VSYDPVPEIQDYLGRLAAAAHDLPETRREELLGEIEEHIRQAAAEKPAGSRGEMLALLAQVGDPAEIAAAAHDPADAVAPRRRRWRTMVVALAVLAVVIALAAGAAAWAWTYQPLAFAPADVLPANAVNTYGEDDHGALVGYNEHGHPFFGVTLENTGHFTVRVLGNAEYGAPLPIFRTWSARLLGARYVKADKPHCSVREKVPLACTLKLGPLKPFSPVDLAPGQSVMLLWLGVGHDCHINVSSGTTTPPRTLPLRYSFLGKTSTAQIPFPGGLTIAPPHHNPACGQPIASGRSTPDLPKDLNAMKG
jgi:HAAS domain-containing protein